MNRIFLAGLLAVSLAPALLLNAAEPDITAKDLPRAPFVPPEQSIGTSHVKPGFHVELAASEPNLASPVAMAFDERGRLFVVGMIDYSERREVIPHLGRIRMMEDTKGNGVFDKSTVYADNLPWPTAVFPWKGGVVVGCTPDIVYLKDTKGNGKADLREVLFTGFASGVDRTNVQALTNSFIWSLDNRIHGTSSTIGGKVTSGKHPEMQALEHQGHEKPEAIVNA